MENVLVIHFVKMDILSKKARKNNRIKKIVFFTVLPTMMRY